VNETTARTAAAATRLWPPDAPTKRMSATPRSEARGHLRAVDRPCHGGPRFAALDSDVARALGPRRGAAILYGVLASTWYEFADPERKKTLGPGGWVEVDYATFMETAGTRAKSSIVRWLRVLAEEDHPCPWGRCTAKHPLIVIRRQGLTRPNCYRKWRCDEDELAIRQRIHSQKFSEATQRHPSPSVALPLEAPPEVSQRDFRKSHNKTSGSLTARLQEVSQSDFRESYSETSYHTNKNKNTQKAAKERAAAVIEHVSEVDAVACEAVEAIVGLARRAEPTYPEERAWAVARTLAAASLEIAQGDAPAARAILLRAITDRRLTRAHNPVGLLIRGLSGDAKGRDRFLIDLRALTDARPASRTDQAASHAPLADRLATDDPATYRAHLERILQHIDLPAVLNTRRSLEHPMLLAICRARLERELQQQQNAP
jgi:hypothetical protein